MAQTAMDSSAMQETQVQSLSGKKPLEKGRTTTAVLLPGEFHEQRSLAGYSSWGHKELGHSGGANIFTFTFRQGDRKMVSEQTDMDRWYRWVNREIGQIKHYRQLS